MTGELKGNALVAQSGGPSAVINETLVGVIQECTRQGGIRKIFGARHGVAGIVNEDLVDLGAEREEQLEAVARTPSAALGSVRMKPTKDDCMRVFEVLRAHDVRYFFYIGGNDSAETAQIVQSLSDEARYEVRLFHVPKTIDNDLLVTDHTPGYGSAARFIACALAGDDLDNRALPGIKVNIIMGRHAGFLAAASILARREETDGPHLVYVPEVPFEIDRFVEDVGAVYDRIGRCTIAVSEGVHPAGGASLLESHDRDSHGNIQLSGTGALGDYLSNVLRTRLGGRHGEKIRVRGDTFGYLQRSFVGVVSRTDAREARLVGVEAVKAAASGAVEGSIALERVGGAQEYDVRTFVTPLESVARRTKTLPREFVNEAGNNIEESYRGYVAPLVGDLPEVGRLAMHRVRKKLHAR